MAQEVGERWHIDLFGPFPADNKQSGKPLLKSTKLPPIQLLSDNIRENKQIRGKGQYVIGAVDAFSKFFVTDIIPEKSAEQIVKFVMTNIICVYGFPHILTSDNGSEFDTELIKRLLSIYEVTQITTSRYSPRANGEIERRWRVLKNILRRN